MPLPVPALAAGGCRKWLSGLAGQRQYEKRNEVLAARQALEQQFAAEDDDRKEGKAPP